MPTSIAFHSIAQSNIPPKEKSSILRLVDNLTGGAMTKAEEKSHETIVHKGHMVSLGHLLRQDTEATLAGMIAGTIDAEMGSTHAPLLMGIAGAIGALACSGHWSETTFRNVSATGMGIWGYTQAHEFFSVKKTITAHGDTVEGEDPIIAFGKTL
jgi:hypothetical protein